MFVMLIFLLVFFFFLFLVVFSVFGKLSVFMNEKIYLSFIYKWSTSLTIFLFFMFMTLFGSLNFFFFFELNYFFNNSLVFVFDYFSLGFFLVGLVVSWSIMFFSLDYMVEEKTVFTFLICLIIFLVFMFLLVFSSNFLVLFIGWEGVGLMSFILISWWGGRFEAMSGGFQAVLYNRVSDSSLLLFLLFLYMGGGGVDLGSFSFFFFFGLFVLSVIAKSSQFFFHPWLPNAMEGPTPVSSLLHSSTMVVASVFLMMRCIDFFNMKHEVYLISIFTCLLSGFLGFNHEDFKKVVAYSTTSQLGFMMMMLGLGLNMMCLLYIIIHAFFKAMLFLVSGYIIHAVSGEQDFRSMSVSSNVNNILVFFFFVSSIVMMGFPFLASFWIKDLALENMVGSSFSLFLYILSLISILLTSMYSMRLFFSLFILNSNSLGKVLKSLSLEVVYPYFRLFMSSVVVSIFLFVFFNPFNHMFLSETEKNFPLLSFFISVLFSFFFIFFFSKHGSVMFNYFMGYNPMIHKMFSGMKVFWSGLVNKFDFIFLDHFFGSGMMFLEEKFYIYRFFLYFLLCLFLVVILI